MLHDAFWKEGNGCLKTGGREVRVAAWRTDGGEVEVILCYTIDMSICMQSRTGQYYTIKYYFNICFLILYYVT